MKKRRVIQRKKIIIYYVLAIVFPCIILGILAYRGVKNDQALLEREQGLTFQESGQEISNEIEAHFRVVEKSFDKLIISRPKPDKDLFSDSVLNSLITIFPVIEGIFHLSDKNKVSLLNQGLLYGSQKSKGSKSGYPFTPAEQTLERAWKLEFIQNEYSKAIDLYRSALGGNNTIQDQGEFNNAIARLQKKLGRPKEAIKTYNSLLNNYSDVFIQGDIPLGMIALLESGLLYLEMKDTIQCLETFNSLLNQIMDSRWSINHSTFYNTISKIKETNSLLEDAGAEVESLLKDSKMLLENIRVLEQKSAYLLTLTNKTWSIQSEQSSIADNSSNRYLFNNNGNSYFVFLSMLEEHGQWGLIYNQEYFLHNIIHTTIRKIADESIFNWELADNYGSIMLNSENISSNAIPVKVMLSPSLPSWTLLFYPKSEEFLSSFIQTRGGIFFYIFLLIVIILACGLFFTLYTVNNELRLTRMKSNFITTVSHEFKSPLTLIRQMAEMLDEGRVPDENRQKKYYSSILQESERLSHLIDNILDFSKMEAGQKIFNFEEGNLAMVVEETVRSFQHQLTDKGFQLKLNLHEVIPDSIFDKEAIRQVLQNLIDNACKYSDDSKIIEVKVSKVDSGISISVKDFGIGIKKDEQDKIFSRFYRAGDELTQKVKGSGIGLIIVKQIVEAHKGAIKLKSELGKGSDFQLILPLKI